MPNPKTIDALSFEDALKELETIVHKLETGDSPLDESISAYERGTTLRKHCEEKLREAQIKIEKISITADGTVTMKPLDSEE